MAILKGGNIMKGYQEQKYPVTISVRVKWADLTHYDCVKGLNIGHALYLARRNWAGAIITATH